MHWMVCLNQCETNNNELMILKLSANEDLMQFERRLLNSGVRRLGLCRSDKVRFPNFNKRVLLFASDDICTYKQPSK